MRTLLTSTAFAALASPLWAIEPLVTPTELQSVDDAIILDIRGGEYTEGHIEGAVHAPYGLFRGPAENPGALVPVEQLETTFESLGLTQERPIVIVSQGASDTDFGAAARVYWTLKSTGFTELSILNGGALSWVNANLPLSTEEAEITPTELDLTWDNTWTSDTAAVNKIIAGESSATLLDARPAAFFEGKQAHGAASRPGTLPGAQNVAYTEFFQSGATAISTSSDVDNLLNALGIPQEEEIVSFCNTGHWAATNWFALSEIEGRDNVTLYPGSMVEYSATDGKMENQPGLISNFLRQFSE